MGVFILGGLLRGGLIMVNLITDDFMRGNKLPQWRHLTCFYNNAEKPYSNIGWEGSGVEPMLNACFCAFITFSFITLSILYAVTNKLLILATNLFLDGVAAYLDHSVTAPTDLKAAVTEHVPPVSRLVQPPTQLLSQTLRGADETLPVQLRPVEVASCKGRTTHIELCGEKY